MKKIYTLIILLFIFQTGIGQIIHVHTHLNNNDVQTRKKLATLIATISARNTELTVTNGILAKTLADHKAQLLENYTRNSFDKKDNFLASSSTSIALSLATSILGEYTNLPYMTRSKRDYLKALTMEKAVLMALQYIDANKVTSGNRQEIYRLRSELIREFSKNDREARKILMFSAAGWSIMNYTAFLELKNKLEAVEIAF